MQFHFLVLLIVYWFQISCYPPFGCARKWRVSTYTSILAGTLPLFCFVLFFKILFILFFREGKGEWEGEKHQCVVASHALPAGDLACNPGMCPRLWMEQATLWFTGQHSTDEPHQPGQYHSFLIHSFTDGHLDCFQHLTIVNFAAMNISYILEVC